MGSFGQTSLKQKISCKCTFKSYSTSPFYPYLWCISISFSLKLPVFLLAFLLQSVLTLQLQFFTLTFR
jgi:hypothetical protein